ncbi:MAG: pyridoxamine 5'-phosphate oxidase family protein [Ilumatobacteraceae bacterium]|jgi:hypothetical protein
MSIRVAIEELEQALAEYPWGYVLTVSDDGRAHVLAVPTHYVDGVLVAPIGRSTTVNVSERPDVSMLFPPASGTGYSLIVDGTATIVDGDLHLDPVTAVRHRPAL